MLDEGPGVSARGGPFDFTFGLKGLVQGLPPLLAGRKGGGGGSLYRETGVSSSAWLCHGPPDPGNSEVLQPTL